MKYDKKTRMFIIEPEINFEKETQEMELDSDINRDIDISQLENDIDNYANDVVDNITDSLKGFPDSELRPLFMLFRARIIHKITRKFVCLGIITGDYASQAKERVETYQDMYIELRRENRKFGIKEAKS